MLSALILAPSPETCPPQKSGLDARPHEAIARSLGALVSAAVANVVHDACIVGPSNSGLEALADYAGCLLIEDADPLRAFTRAVTAARSGFIFVLRAGYAPNAGFIDEIGDIMGVAQPRAFALRAEPETFPQRLAPALAPDVAVGATREACLATGVNDPGRLARLLKAQPMRTKARRLI